MAGNAFDQLGKVVARLIENVPFFKGLKQAELFEFLAKAEHKGVKKGETVFREGDEAAQMIFLVIKGAVEVRKNLPDGSSELVNALGVGACFGEMALVDAQPRSATVVAKEDSVLLAFTGNFLATFPGIAYRLYENLARIIAERHLDTEKELKFHLLPICNETCVAEIVKNLPPASAQISARGMATLAQVGQAYAVAAKEYVVKENALGQNMYIVLDGALEVCRNVEGDSVRLALLRRGNYFGEVALVSSEHGRTADVVAVEDAKLIRINAGHLQKSPELGAAIYKELARIFSMRLRRSTKIYMQTVGQNCQAECPMANDQGGI